MTNPVTLSDVEDRFYRPLTDRELVNASMWLTDAWWLVTTRIPNLESNIDDDLVPVGNVVSAVTSMVHRMLKNPEGLITESVDDYSYRRSTNVASGALSMTRDELALLSPGGIPRVKSIRLVAYGEV